MDSKGKALDCNSLKMHSIFHRKCISRIRLFNFFIFLIKISLVNIRGRKTPYKTHLFLLKSQLYFKAWKIERRKKKLFFYDEILYYQNNVLYSGVSLPKQTNRFYLFGYFGTLEKAHNFFFYFSFLLCSVNLKKKEFLFPTLKITCYYLYGLCISIVCRNEFHSNGRRIYRIRLSWRFFLNIITKTKLCKFYTDFEHAHRSLFSLQKAFLEFIQRLTLNEIVLYWRRRTKNNNVVALKISFLIIHIFSYTLNHSLWWSHISKMILHTGSP